MTPKTSATAVTPLLAAALLALAVGACGDGTTDPPSPDPPRATTVTVAPEAAEMTALGDTVQLAATVRDQNGQAMSGVTVAWTSGDPSVATVQASGLVKAVANGTATVTAAAGSVSGTASVTVEQRLTEVRVSPDADTLVALGDTLRLSAEAFDANGHPVAGAEFAWASGDEMVATVDASGVVTAAGNGEANITAAAGSTVGSATVVVAQVAAEVTVTPGHDTLLVTDTVPLLAEVYDSNAFPIVDAEILWSSEDESVASVDTLGWVAAVGEGVTIITASADDVDGTAEIRVLAPETGIEDFVSGVQVGGAGVTARRGSPPPEGAGPEVDAETSSLSIINGGTLQLRVESADQFSVLYLFVRGVGTAAASDSQAAHRPTPGGQRDLQLEKSRLSARPYDAPHGVLSTNSLRAGNPLLVGGYYEIVFDEVVSTASLLLQFAQSLPATSFELLVGAARSVGGLPGFYERFGLEATIVGSGDLQVSLSWDSNADLDLHVVEPSGEEIYWKHRASATGGVLDLDGNAVCRSRLQRNENITWPTGTAPAGRYTVRVNHWSNCGADLTNYVVRVELPDGRSEVHTGIFTGSGNRGGRGSGRTIGTFAIDREPGRVAIARVEPTVLIEGKAATIIGSGFSTLGFRNHVLIDGVRAEVTDATRTRLSITIPKFDCLPPRMSQLRVTVGGEVATRTVRVTPRTLEDLELEQYWFRYTYAGNGCVYLPPGDEFLIGVTSTSEDPGSLTPITLTGIPETRPSWSEPILLALV